MSTRGATCEVYGPVESVYNLCVPLPEPLPRLPMFRSSRKAAPPTASTFNPPGTTHPLVTNCAGDASEPVIKPSAHGHFGKPLGSYKSVPSGFLKKMARSSSVPTLAEIRKSNPEALKPTRLRKSRFTEMGGGGPPKRGDEPVMNLVSSKNFIVANAVETILAQPRRPTNHVKDYMKKEDYGKAPKYLKRIQRDLDSERAYIERFYDSQEQEPATQALEESERLSMLEGLKAKWEQANTEYQRTTHCTYLDTEGLKRNKEKSEAALTNLENDIGKLSKAGIIVDLER